MPAVWAIRKAVVAVVARPTDSIYVLTSMPTKQYEQRKLSSVSFKSIHGVNAACTCPQWPLRNDSLELSDGDFPVHFAVPGNHWSMITHTCSPQGGDAMPLAGVSNLFVLGSNSPLTQNRSLNQLRT